MSDTTTAPPAAIPAVLAVAALASAAAGLVHAAAAGTHQGDDTLVRLFGATAVAQLAWAALVAFVAPVASPATRRLLLATGLGLNGAAAAAWLASRTAGLPLIDSLREVEPVGTQDAIAAALGALAAGVPAALLMGGLQRALPRFAPALAGVAVLAVAVAGTASGHGHGPSHDHDHGHDGVELASGGGAGTHGHHGHGAVDTAATEPSGPVTSLDDPRVTPAQRAAAQDLIDRTTAAMAAFPDVAAVEAAGYISIGDGVTGYEHFIRIDYIADGIEVDPSRIESIVAEVGDDGTKRVVSAMYILAFGKTMADVPDIAGELTTWHDHQDLCWEGARVVARKDAAGNCPRGVFRATPPMLHVWMVEHPCGPFAGLDGHGGGEGCAHDHGDQPHADHGSGTAAGGGHHHGAIPARLDHPPTEAQKAVARKLIADTKEHAARYADVKAAEAAGYRSIGDSFTGVEHFVHHGYKDDPDILNPRKIESLVYRVEPGGGRTLVTAMYLLPPGSTMDDVPDVAGNLTVWHDHQNLCWDDTGTRLAGTLRDGRCVPGGTFRPTAPMLHVWVTENPCGPFAGTDTGQMTGSCVQDF